MLKTKQLIKEYKRIGTLPTLSETDSELLAEILAIAESDSVLADLICEADLQIADELDLIDEESIRHSEEVRLKLAKRFGMVSVESEKNLVSSSERRTVEPVIGEIESVNFIKQDLRIDTIFRVRCGVRYAIPTRSCSLRKSC